MATWKRQKLVINHFERTAYTWNKYVIWKSGPYAFTIARRSEDGTYEELDALRGQIDAELFAEEDAAREARRR